MAQISQDELVKSIALEVSRMIMPKLKGVIRSVIKEENSRLFKATNKSVKKIVENAVNEKVMKILLDEKRDYDNAFVDDSFDFDKQDTNLQSLKSRKTNESARARARDIIEKTYGKDGLSDLISSAGDEDGSYQAYSSTDRPSSHLTEYKPISNTGKKIPIQELAYSDNPVEDFGTDVLDPLAIDYSAMMDEMERRGSLVDTSKRWGIESKGESGSIDPAINQKALVKNEEED